MFHETFLIIRADFINIIFQVTYICKNGSKLKVLGVLMVVINVIILLMPLGGNKYCTLDFKYNNFQLFESHLSFSPVELILLYYNSSKSKCHQTEDHHINFGSLFHLSFGLQSVYFMTVTHTGVWLIIGTECCITVCGACDLYWPRDWLPPVSQSVSLPKCQDSSSKQGNTVLFLYFTHHSMSTPSPAHFFKPLHALQTSFLLQLQKYS